MGFLDLFKQQRQAKEQSAAERYRALLRKGIEKGQLTASENQELGRLIDELRLSTEDLEADERRMRQILDYEAQRAQLGAAAELERQLEAALKKEEKLGAERRTFLEAWGQRNDAAAAELAELRRRLSALAGIAEGLEVIRAERPHLLGE